MKLREWVNYVAKADMPYNGIFMASITDDVLDQEAWPLWVIHVVGGIIKYIIKITPGVYGIPDMVGWSRDQLIEWIQEDSTGSHPCVDNVLMYLGPEDKEEPYWFTVATYASKDVMIALDMLASYKVRFEAVGNGDNVEYILVNEETREGDLVLAEMCFSGNGWRQEKVCPVCKDKGESICGHYHFTRYVTPEF